MLKGAFIFFVGAGLSWFAQQYQTALAHRFEAQDRATVMALASTAAELRQSSRKLRARCPSRARVTQPLIFTPGAPI